MEYSRPKSLDLLARTSALTVRQQRTFIFPQEDRASEADRARRLEQERAAEAKRLRRLLNGQTKAADRDRQDQDDAGETEQQPEAWVHNSTETEISRGDTRQLIQKVIDSLPPPQQQAVELAFFQGMSQREIAAKTNTPLGTVKTRLELGLKKIYDGLKELRHEL